MQECTDRDPRPLEWKDGEGEREQTVDEQAIDAAWQTLKPKLGPKNWTVSESFTFRGFFAWGWEARKQYIQPEIDALKAEVKSWLAAAAERSEKAASLQDELIALKAEVAHWKANHANMVNRSRVLIDRTDLPLERVKAFKQLETLKAENEKLRNAAEEAHALLIEIDKQVTLTESACEVMDDLGAALNKVKP